MTFRLENVRIKKLILYSKDGREIPVYTRNTYADNKGKGYWRKLVEEKLKKIGLERTDLQFKFTIITDEGSEIPVNLINQRILPEKVAREIAYRIFRGEK